MDIEDLITQSDAARLRNVKPSRINRLVKDNRLKVFTVAGKPLVSRTDVLALKALPAGRPPKEKLNAKSHSLAAGDSLVTSSKRAAKAKTVNAKKVRTKK